MTRADARLHSAAAERNRQPIAERLQAWLPERGGALEIASGTGQHAVHFARHLPGWIWQPTDRDPAALASIEAWRTAAGLINLRAPLAYDVTQASWPLADAPDAIFCANMIHIAPWSACVGLLNVAARRLAAGGVLVLYGPVTIDGEPAAPGNLAFDADLRARDPAWGVRHLAEIEREATRAGLVLQARAALPADNTMLRFGRAADRALSASDGPVPSPR